MPNGNGALTTNRQVTTWVDEMAALCLPDRVVWVDGGDGQRDALTAEACRTGEIVQLNQEKYPGCYYHRTHPQDVARVEDKTFICCRNQKDAGATNNWKAPEEAYTEAANFFRSQPRIQNRFRMLEQIGLDYLVLGQPSETLSGGESFMAALSLALGLSDVVQSYAGGIKLDTLFIDEGFGSLDPESLDLAIKTLIDLQSTGRMIGIISHVGELKEQMALRIDVKSARDGSSITTVAHR